MVARGLGGNASCAGSIYESPYGVRGIIVYHVHYSQVGVVVISSRRVPSNLAALPIEVYCIMRDTAILGGYMKIDH